MLAFNQIVTKGGHMLRAIPVAVILCGVCFAQTSSKNAGAHLLTHQELGAVVQAVEDEIYDYSYQSKFSFVGDAPSGSTKVPIYISPKVDHDSIGEVIYKYMPFGEVYRRFVLRDDGLVILYGDPELTFPPQLPDTNTLYLDDEDVCRMKSEWKKTQFVVDPNASKERIEFASRRQKERVKFSKIEYNQNPENKKQ
jgi:hypothetical protein